MPGLNPLDYLARFKNYVIDKATESAPANWILAANDKITTAKETAKTAGASIVSGVTFGAKYGLIIFAVILALFVIAQFKTITAAFKE